MLRRLIRFLRNEDGATAVEFGMVSMFLFLTLFTLVELGRIFWTWSALEYAVERTARYALTHSNASNSELAGYAAENMQGIMIDSKKLAVTVNRIVQNEVKFVHITGAYTFDVLNVSFMGKATQYTLDAEAKIAVP